MGSPPSPLPQGKVEPASAASPPRNPSKMTRNHLGRFSKRLQEHSSRQEPPQPMPPPAGVPSQAAKVNKPRRKTAKKLPQQATQEAVDERPCEIPEYIINRITGLPMANPKSMNYTVNFRREFYPGLKPGEAYPSPAKPFVDESAYAISTRHVPPQEALGYDQNHLTEILVRRKTEEEAKAEIEDDENGQDWYATSGETWSYRRTMRLGDGKDEEYASGDLDALLTSVQKVPSSVVEEEDKDDDDERNGDEVQDNGSARDGSGDDESSEKSDLSNDVVLSRIFGGRSTSSRC